MDKRKSFFFVFAIQYRNCFSRGFIVTMAYHRIEQSRPTNFNRIQNGAWLKSSCVQNLKFPKPSNLGFVQFLHEYLEMA